ncbi:MAG: hypothetical protein MJ133_04330 [Lachnospiraceae bacterium]|nr:hypothetical protein [Lachnospiraceae bacterium]
MPKINENENNNVNIPDTNEMSGCETVSAPAKSNRLFKKIVAWVSLALLVLLYLSTLIIALLGASYKDSMFMMCIYLTLVVPVVAFVLIWLSDRQHNRRSLGDK